MSVRFWLLFETDLGFDVADIDVMFGNSYAAPKKVVEERQAKEAEKVEEEFTPDNFREIKKEMRDAARQENAEGESYKLSDTDYNVTFVFPNNSAKHEFMRKIKKPIDEKFLKSSVLMDIFNHVYNISVLGE